MYKTIASTIIVCLFAFISNPCQAEINSKWKELHDLSLEVTLEDVLTNNLSDLDEPSRTYVLGIKYLEQFNFKKAQETFEQLKSTQKDCYLCDWGLAEIQCSQYQLKSCKPALKKLIKEHPDFVPPYVSLAKLSYMNKEWKNIARFSSIIIDKGRENVDFRSFVQAHAFSGAARGLLAYHGGALSKLYNGYASLRHLKAVKKLAPDSFVYYFSWGNYYALAPSFFGGDIDKAIEYFDKTIELNPEFSDAYVRLAQAHKKKGDEELYEKYLSIALEMDHQNPLALDVQQRTCDYICLDTVE